MGLKHQIDRKELVQRLEKVQAGVYVSRCIPNRVVASWAHSTRTGVDSTSLTIKGIATVKVSDRTRMVPRVRPLTTKPLTTKRTGRDLCRPGFTIIWGKSGSNGYSRGGSVTGTTGLRFKRVHERANCNRHQNASPWTRLFPL